MLEAIFGDLVKGLVVESLHGRFRRGFRAMIDQEIATTEMNKSVSQLFSTALSHLKNAELELESSPTERQQIEYARLAFVDLVHLDASLPAVRAACYAGFCHRLKDEPEERTCYERSLAMIVAIETRLGEKVTEKSLPIAGAVAVFSSPLLDLPAIFAPGCVQRVRKNLDAQFQIVSEHKEAINAVVKITKRNIALGSAWRSARLRWP
jgi:hypothetical protein